MNLLRQLAGAPRAPVAARRWQLACALAVIPAPVAVVCAAVLLATGVARAGWLGPSALGIAVVVAGAVWTTLFSTLAELCGQHARDLGAADLFTRLQRGEAPATRYALYLRPFATTDAIEERALVLLAAGSWSAVLGGGSIRYEFEQQIERSLRGFGPLVGLGLPLEHVGAGRIVVGDDEWRQAVALLAAHAALIVLLPSNRPGTAWEVEHILDSDLARRTVVVDPPGEGNAAYAQHAEWREVRLAFERRGYIAPPDHPEGTLLYYGPNRSPALVERLDLDAEGAITRFFREAAALAVSAQGET